MDHNVSLNTTSFRQAALFIILLACTIGNSGCFYYKSVGYDRTATRQKKFCRQLRSSLNTDKYVIVHRNNSMQHMTNLFLNLPDRKHCSADCVVMYGGLEEVDSLAAFYHHKYKEKNRRAVRYFGTDEDHVLGQVHVYLAENNAPLAASVSIPISAINRIEMYKQATGRTAWTWSGLNLCLEVMFSSHSPSKQTSNTHNGPRPSHDSKPKQTPNTHHAPRSK